MTKEVTHSKDGYKFNVEYNVQETKYQLHQKIECITVL